jgi:methyl-accepting chemotaxis protein
MRSTDLSIGQRLALGFGLFFTVVILLLAAAFHLHASSARAQARYSDVIEPLSSRLHALERDIYSVGLSVRSVLLPPVPERLASLRQSTGKARATLQLLGDLPMQADGRSLYAQIAQAAQVYLQAAEQMAQDRIAGGAAQISDEANLAKLRASLFEYTGQFGLLQKRRAASALAEIADARERISQGLVTAAIVTVIALTIVAWLTARTVSRPAQELLRKVDAIEAGDWKPALELAVHGDPGTSAPARDEMRRLASAFGSAAVALERREQRLVADGLVAKAIAATLDRNAVGQEGRRRGGIRLASRQAAEAPSPRSSPH